MMQNMAEQAELVKTDIVQQFFLAKISVGAVWDDTLKNNDHYDICSRWATALGVTLILG